MEIFTIGHSNHSADFFVNLLKHHGITAVADVRSFPFSRRFPQFSQATLKIFLADQRITYVFLGKQLGARPNDSSCYENGKAKYELIANTEFFLEGLHRLIDGARKHRIALMCAEQDPIVCHRAILVCQHLKKTNFEIRHILKDGSLELHEHLEERLLSLHNLDNKEMGLNGKEDLLNRYQLQLFNTQQKSESYKEDSLISKESGTFLSHKAYLQLSFLDENLDVIKELKQDAHADNKDKLIQEVYRLQADRIAYIDKKIALDESSN